MPGALRELRQVEEEMLGRGDDLDLMHGIAPSCVCAWAARLRGAREAQVKAHEALAARLRETAHMLANKYGHLGYMAEIESVADALTPKPENQP